MPLRDLDDGPVVESCWRCGSRDADTLRRLIISHLSRFVVVERVLCRACIERIQFVIENTSLDALLQGDG